MEQIGVIAGVFDPIHLGHTDFIRQTIKNHNLDKVYMLVEKNPKYKTCFANYKQRRKMVELAINEIPTVEIYESQKDFFPISSTLPKLKAENPAAKLYLLLGDDVAEHIPQWENSEYLLQNAELIIAKRNRRSALSQASSLKIRQKLENGQDVSDLDPAVLAYCQSNKLY